MLLFEIQIQTESSNPCYCLCICRFRIIAIYTIIFCFSGWIQIFQLYRHIIVIRFASIDYTHTEYIHDLYRLESGWCSTYDDTQEVNYANFNEFAPLFSRDTRMSIQSYLIHATPRSTVHSFDLQVPSEQRLCILFFSPRKIEFSWLFYHALLFNCKFCVYTSYELWEKSILLFSYSIAFGSGHWLCIFRWNNRRDSLVECPTGWSGSNWTRNTFVFRIISSSAG